MAMRSGLSPLRRLYQGKRPSVVTAVTLGLLLVIGATLLVLRMRTSPLTLHVAVMKRRGDSVTVLKDGEVMTSEDYYGVWFQPVQKSFVYVFQQDGTGKIDVLFPDPHVALQANPIPADTPVWVPQDVNHWFYLDEHVGRETIIVVALPQRDVELEALLRSMKEGNDQSALARWVSSPDLGVGGVRHKITFQHQ